MSDVHDSLEKGNLEERASKVSRCEILSTDVWNGLVNALPGYLISIVGGWLIAALDPVQYQVMVSFDLTKCSDYTALECFDSSKGTRVIAGVNAALFAGAIVGCLMNRYIAQIGRVVLLMSITAFVIPGSLLVGFAPDGMWELLVLGRFIAGVGVGLVCVSVPMYVGEVVPLRHRGAFLTAQWLLQGLGSLCAAVFGGLGLFPNPPGTDGYENTNFQQWWWRITQLVPAILSALTLLMLLLGGDETPYILIKQGKFEKARENIARINCKESVNFIDEEFAVTKRSVLKAIQQRSSGVGPVALMRDNREYVHALLVGMALGGLQNLSGARALFTSSNSLFVQAGLGVREATAATIGLLALNLLGNTIAIRPVDYWGRTTMLKLSFGGQAVACLIGASAYWTSPPGDSSAVVTITAIVAIFLFFFAYSVGVGPIPCMYLSEIFPANFKGFGMGLGAACNWTGIMIMSYVSLIASNEVIFTLFLAVSILGFLFTHFFVLETKGRSVFGSPFFKAPVEMERG